VRPTCGHHPWGARNRGGYGEHVGYYPRRYLCQHHLAQIRFQTAVRSAGVLHQLDEHRFVGVRISRLITPEAVVQ
jgi:hypothetical protein